MGEPLQSPATVTVGEQVWERWRALSADSSKPWVALLFSSELDTQVAQSKLAEAVGEVVSEFERTQENLPAGVEEVGAGAWNLAKVPEGVMLTVGEKCEAFELLLERSPACSSEPVWWAHLASTTYRGWRGHPSSLTSWSSGCA